MGPLVEHARLAAYVDGALEPEEAAGVVMHLADHPEDQAYVDGLIAMNESLVAAYSAPLSEAVPEPVRQVLRGDRVAKPRTAARLPGWLLPYAAVAAAAAVLVFVSGEVFRSEGPETALLGVGPVMTGSDLYAALEGQPSGYHTTLATGHELTLIATFRHGFDGYCREIEAMNAGELTFTRAIACRGPEAWDIAVSVSEPIRGEEASEGYLPAADTSVAALGAALDALNAGASLPPQVEKTLIDSGWAP